MGFFGFNGVSSAPRVRAVVGPFVGTGGRGRPSGRPGEAGNRRKRGPASSKSRPPTREGQLWGLISGRSGEPKRPGFELRTACDLIGQVFSMQLSSREHTERYEARIKRK